MELENERNEHVLEVLAKYAISSLEETTTLCLEKNIDVKSIVCSVKEDSNEYAIAAYTLGVAIALKKDTKLASYVAMDIGEGLQAFCIPGSEAYESKAGLGHGYQASNYIKEGSKEDAKDYASLLSFMELTNEQLLEITSKLSKEVESKLV